MESMGALKRARIPREAVWAKKEAVPCDMAAQEQLGFALKRDAGAQAERPAGICA